MSETDGFLWGHLKSASNGLANATRAVADDMVKQNAAFASGCGLKTYITRTLDGESCDFCEGLAGKYEYGNAPKNVYVRHTGCGCTVTYTSSKGVQDAYTKQWTKSTDADTIKSRENLGRRTDIPFDNDKFTIAEAKLTEYLLKPGGKHAAEFFDVGYDSRDPGILLADIYDQFDIESKSDVRELGEGSTRFSIEMQLGVTNKKLFVTGWIIDGSESKPRFITAHRTSNK